MVKNNLKKVLVTGMSNLGVKSTRRNLVKRNVIVMSDLSDRPVFREVP